MAFQLRGGGQVNFNIIYIAEQSARQYGTEDGDEHESKCRLAGSINEDVEYRLPSTDYDVVCSNNSNSENNIERPVRRVNYAEVGLQTWKTDRSKRIYI